MIEVLFGFMNMLCSISKFVVKLSLNKVHMNCALFWVVW